jgi:hypothetical protein
VRFDEYANDNDASSSSSSSSSSDERSVSHFSQVTRSGVARYDQVARRAPDQVSRRRNDGDSGSDEELEEKQKKVPRREVWGAARNGDVFGAVDPKDVFGAVHGDDVFGPAAIDDGGD